MIQTRHTPSVRKLTAIMFTDIIGYTSLMGEICNRKRIRYFGKGKVLQTIGASEIVIEY